MLPAIAIAISMVRSLVAENILITVIFIQSSSDLATINSALLPPLLGTLQHCVKRIGEFGVQYPGIADCLNDLCIKR